MTNRHFHSAVNHLLSEYGMVVVLFLLCVFFCAVTYDEQHPTGVVAARQLGSAIRAASKDRDRVVIVVRDSTEDRLFAEELRKTLSADRLEVVGTVRGQPADARRAITQLGQKGEPIAFFACNQVTSNWEVFAPLQQRFPSLAGARIFKPESYYWPNFLKTENLLNIANQIAVIAIIAIGMTMVIITGGIDLSVGSLIALSAVVTSRLIRDLAGGDAATTSGMILASVCGILACAVCGLFSGAMVTLFAIPPFIVTLAMMLATSGLAYILAEGQSINQVPDAFVWLGRGADVFWLPNAVLLMIVLYAVAHLMMKRMRIGRYIYAVGGNSEAARLSGVSIRSVLLLVYALCGALAGLGGVITASQLKSGAPTYGQMYELYVIAAVVVGGTSLSGGSGKILGTLVGALIIAVIQNGMNLRGVESYTQKIILGGVILGAVLLDRLKRRPRG
ncbi:MAG: sugar-transporting ATPase [Planctomycetota bacterium]|nr:sugar-transporting ATPase [Planctomycetota bacterium]